MLHVYRASAGSGKTYELAYRYIRQLLRNHKNGMQNPHHDILAVTFTNKATEEMTKRIVHELAVLAKREHGWEDQSSPYAKALKEDLGVTDNQLENYAGQCLDALLADFDHFGVSTIDAFFQTILRAFTYEAELAGDYELELDKKAVISNAVAQLLEDIDNNKYPKDDPDNAHLSKQIKALMEKQLDNSKDPNFFNREGAVQSDVVGYIDAITDETFALNQSDIEAFFTDDEKFKGLKECLDTKDIENEIRDLCKNTPKVLDGATTYTLNLFDAEKYIAKPETPGGTTFQNIFVNPIKNFKKNQHTEVKEKLLQEAATRLKELIGALRYKKQISQQLDRTTILQRILDAKQTQQSDTSTILLSDTNTLLRSIISQDESPFIYERIGNRLRHFLIDEFQDTSAMQWEIFKPLLMESLSNNEGHNVNNGEPGNESLIIGDEKQSIYGFRNSDASMLTKLSKGEDIDTEYCKSTSSKKNWRSSHPVVTFNNIFFTNVLNEDKSLTDLYNNVVQEPVEKTGKMHGRIYARPVPADGNTPKMSVKDIIDNIIEQLERGFNPGDIAVLVRTNKLAQTFIDEAGELAHEPVPENCEDAVKESIQKRKDWLAKLKFAGDDSVSLTSSTTVQLVINILRFVGASDFTLSDKNMSEKSLALLFSNFEREIAQGKEPSDALSVTLAKYREEKLEPLDLNMDTDPDLLTLPSMVEKIINDFVSREMRQKENLYLSTLLDTVNQYCTFGIPDVRSFLSWWDSKSGGITLSVGRDRDALTVMTAHKSKGLEFPCVHYVALPAKGGYSNYKWVEGSLLKDIPEELRPEWFPVNLGQWMLDTPLEKTFIDYETQKNIDEVNLVYVAMTRAKNELNIYYIDAAPAAMENNGVLPVSIYNKIGAMLSLTAADPESGLVTEDGKIFHSKTEPQRHETETAKELPTALDPDPAHPYVPAPDMVAHDELWKHTVLESEDILTDSDDEGDDVPIIEPDPVLQALRSILADLTNKADMEKVCQRHDASPAVRELLTKCIKAQGEWFEGPVTTCRIFKRRWKNNELATAVVDRMIVRPDGSLDLIVYKNSDPRASNPEAKVKRILHVVNLHKHPGSKGWIWDLSTGEAKAVTPGT